LKYKELKKARSLQVVLEQQYIGNIVVAITMSGGLMEQLGQA
jgi:hypothetical protein